MVASSINKRQRIYVPAGKYMLALPAMSDLSDGTGGLKRKAGVYARTGTSSHPPSVAREMWYNLYLTMEWRRSADAARTRINLSQQQVRCILVNFRSIPVRLCSRKASLGHYHPPWTISEALNYSQI